MAYGYWGGVVGLQAVNKKCRKICPRTIFRYFFKS